MITRSARQQLARLLPLAVLVLLAIIGLRGTASGPRWDGPLKSHGTAIGIALEVILAALLAAVFYRQHAARPRSQQGSWPGQAARDTSAGWVTGAAASEMTRLSATGGAASRLGSRSETPASVNGDVEDDRDVPGSLRFLLKLVLASAMIAIAALELANLHLHLFSGAGRRSSQGIRLPVPSRTAQPTPAHAATGHAIPLSVIGYVLLVLALVAALVASLWWGRRIAAAAAAHLPAAQPGEEEEEEELRAAVASGRAAMALLDDARAAIIACYEAMEGSLAQRGTARGAAGTPGELLERARGRGIITGQAAGTLTALFYEARFSSHALGAPQRAAAMAALDEIAAELSAAPARAQGTP